MLQDCPNLNDENVIPIIVSASFLKVLGSCLYFCHQQSVFQIDDLVEKCVDYIHMNINRVVQKTPTFCAVGDALVSK